MEYIEINLSNGEREYLDERNKPIYPEIKTIQFEMSRHAIVRCFTFIPFLYNGDIFLNKVQFEGDMFFKSKDYYTDVFEKNHTEKSLQEFEELKITTKELCMRECAKWIKFGNVDDINQFLPNGINMYERFDKYISRIL